ncbi:MAG: DUF3500 domain-containing protein [Archangium sp.]
MMKTRVASLAVVVFLFSCGGVEGTDGGTGGGGGTATGGGTGGGTSSFDGGLSTDAGVACSTLGTQQSRVACAANAVLDSLSSTQLGTVSFPLSDYVTRSKWNNLPVGARPRGGAQLSALSSTSQAAVNDLLTISLSSTGQQTAFGILAADEYLAANGGGSQYGSSTYSIAIFGTPTDTGDFEVMFGGHHMAFNMNFAGGAFYPVPQHLGAEPKAAFTLNGNTWSPMAPKGDAMFAVYAALDSTQQSSSYLSGQTFSDVVVTPDLDYGKGDARTTSSAYPAGSNRKGVLVSSMTSAQQALVVAAIEQWARQYPPEVADGLMSAYSSSAAFADTYFAWGGSSAGPDKDVNGSYLRIDGPRCWIELSVQGGVVIRNVSHYHSVFHDKQYDYGGEF